MEAAKTRVEQDEANTRQTKKNYLINRIVYCFVLIFKLDYKRLLLLQQ